MRSAPKRLCTWFTGRWRAVDAACIPHRYEVRLGFPDLPLGKEAAEHLVRTLGAQNVLVVVHSNDSLRFSARTTFKHFTEALSTLPRDITVVSFERERKGGRTSGGRRYFDI